MSYFSIFVRTNLPAPAGRYSVRVMSNILLRAFVIDAALCGPAAPALARVDIFVDLSRQRMTVKKPGGEALVWKVSSDRSGFETPTGVFNVQRMDAEHFSDEYDRAPMPYAIFFSRGLAIHGSYESLTPGVAWMHPPLRPKRPQSLSWVEQYGATIEIAGSADEMVAQDDESYGRQRRERKQRVFTVWPP
jgi:hypothetical protein